MIKSIKVNNSEMKYIEFGEWEKVFVIIPGLSLKSILLSEEAIMASFLEFTHNFTIYLFDKINDIPEIYSIHDMAEDTYNAMINLWIKSCNIFWASQWWMIAQSIAINHPDFIEKMVLWSTTYKTQSHAFKIISKRIELAKTNNIPELNKKFISDVYNKQTISKYWDIILDSNKNITHEDIQRFIKLAYSILDFDVEKDIGKIRCKTLVIGSNNDSIFWWKSQKNLSNKLGSKLYLYENYGHAVYDEAPDFRSKMLSFLNA